MVSAGFQCLGTALGILGWIGGVISCYLPRWKVSTFIGRNIASGQIYSEGIWMSCLAQTNGEELCRGYDPITSDLQAARVLIVISIVVGIVAILLGFAGGKCTNSVKDPSSKVKVGTASGVLFIIAGILCLIPVCWTAISIIRDSKTLINDLKRELGIALYIGCGAAAFMLIGGGMRSCNCPTKDKHSYKSKCKPYSPETLPLLSENDDKEE